jgi:hypothetical protein
MAKSVSSIAGNVDNAIEQEIVAGVEVLQDFVG